MNKKKLKQALLLSLCFLLLTSNCFAATDFTVEVKASGGDYPSFSTAESALDENITAADIKVFSFDANSGTIADGASVSTDGGSTTGVCVHQSVNGQILIKTIAVGTFDDNDVVTDGTNTVTLSNGGDTPKILLKILSNQTAPGQYSFEGGTSGTTNTYTIMGDSSTWDGTYTNAKKITATTYDYSHVRFAQASMYVEKIAFTSDGTSGLNYALSQYSDTSVTMHDIILYQTGATFYNSNTKFVNLIIIDPPANGLSNGSDTWGNIYVYSATIIGAGTYGVYDHVADWKNAGIRLYNTVVVDSGTQDILQDAQGTLQFCDYIATSDSSAACGENVETYTATDIVSADAFASTSTGLLKSGSALIDAGYDYSSLSGFSDDISGTTRSGTWDIGADEYAGWKPKLIGIF